MSPNIIKNMLQAVIHYLECDRHIDLQNDPGCDLDFFLKELNRQRAALGLPLYRLEKRMPMVGRGDWSGRGEKVRFVQNQRSPKVSAAPAPAPAPTPKSKPAELTPKVVKSQPKSLPASRPQQVVLKKMLPFKKITKTKLVAQLNEQYPNIETKVITRDGKKVDQFFSEKSLVGEWCKGRGWFT